MFKTQQELSLAGTQQMKRVAGVGVVGVGGSLQVPGGLQQGVRWEGYDNSVWRRDMI